MLITPEDLARERPPAALPWERRSAGQGASATRD
jgi:hypothetical protein